LPYHYNLLRTFSLFYHQHQSPIDVFAIEFIMLEAAISRLDDALQRHPWAKELAGILPLSALIDFIDVPKKLHVVELAGTVPLWSWPITPAGSRLLLSNEHMQKTCCLDRYGSSVALVALDGRYGDQYVVSSPETIRMCVSSQVIHKIGNSHDNMSGKDLRTQNLEIVHVSGINQEGRLQPSQSWLRRILIVPWSMSSSRYLLVSTMGWIIFIGSIIMSGFFQCYLSLAFLLLTLATGIITFFLYGSTPRRLLNHNGSGFNRLIVVAEHMNSMDWTIFYGDSTVINSLLNRPLEPAGLHVSRSASIIFRMALRIFILGQWGLVLGAAALKDWNAYFITFWIVVCVFSHAYLIPSVTSVNDWMKHRANIKFERYKTQLSSRRALLNTIMALNPDTFFWNEDSKQEDRARFSNDSLGWIDPILAQGSSRTAWESATRAAMDEALQKYTIEMLSSPQWQSNKDNILLPTWSSVYPSTKQNYWKPFILEGIHIAAKIKQEARLSGRKITELI
jgi:hypothetical protein